MPEVRLIDAIELVRYLCGACPSHQNGECIDKMCWKYEDRARIENAPTIEVAPVRRGRWIPTEYDSFADGAPVWDKWECSVCGHEHSVAHLNYDKLTFELSDGEFNLPTGSVTHWMPLPEPSEKE